MLIQVTGKVQQLLDTKYTKTKSGKDCEIRDYLLEVYSGTEYAHSIKFTMASFDGPIQRPLEVGQNITAGLKVAARSFNGKWFNDISLSSWEPAD